jgi:hypothetical protein
MLIKLEYDTICRIKIILEDFWSMSGLLCNVDKTTLLPIGPHGPIDERILNTGFAIVDKVTILGLEINRDGVTNQNFQAILNKIRAIIANWAPYKLSLPGRINIAKSMMYSQINYLGCFLFFPEEFVTSIDIAITNYVKGKLNIAKKQLYKSAKESGLGLFDIPVFLHAQHCAWIKRSLSLDEQWKVQLYINNYGNILNCKASNTNRDINPVLHIISMSYEHMYDKFVQKDENFRSAYIAGTGKMTRDVETRNYITHNFFGREFFLGHAHAICGLKYSDFYTRDDVLIPAETVVENTGIPLTVMMIQTLRGVCRVARQNIVKKS